MSTWVDFACIFPLVQQVVGISAALFHLINTIDTLVTKFFKNLDEEIEENLESLISGIGHLDEKTKDQFITVFKYYNHGSFVTALSRVCTSLIQAIPVVGTCYSLYTYKYSTMYHHIYNPFASTHNMRIT